METQTQEQTQTAPEPADLAEAGERIICSKTADKLHMWFLTLASVYVLWLAVQTIVHFFR